MTVVHDALSWVQGGLQSLWRGLKVRFYEEPPLVLSFVQSGMAMLVGFGLDWSGEQVALFVAFMASALAVIARQNVIPAIHGTRDDELPEPYSGE